MDDANSSKAINLAWAGLAAGGERRENSLAAGMDDDISKLVDPGDLERILRLRVRFVLEGTRLRRAELAQASAGGRHQLASRLGSVESVSHCAVYPRLSSEC